MSARATGLLLLALLAAGAAGLALAAPVRDDPDYHAFADRRTWLGVPHAWNVLSNLPFLPIGAAGIAWAARRRRTWTGPPEARRAYLACFAGVFLTGLGSAWYHLAPDDARLVWDRLPMTVLFLAFFDAVLAERLSPRLAGAILFPLLAFGGASLAWWRARGDLSLYALAQYYPALALPLLLWLRPGRGDAALWSAAGAYALSKACEALDRAIFSLGGVVGGHALKHLFAALAAACLLRAARSGR